MHKYFHFSFSCSEMTNLLANDEFDLINKDMLIDSDMEYIDTNTFSNLYTIDQDDSTESVDSSINEEPPLVDTVIPKVDLFTYGLHPSAFHLLPNQQQVLPPQTEPKKTTTTRYLSKEEKRQHKLLRNRAAAKICRQKKKQKVQDMEERIEKLTRENQSLLELKSRLVFMETTRSRIQELQQALSPALPDTDDF